MAGGIDLALSDLISTWRLSHREATQDEAIKYLIDFVSSHYYCKLEWPKEVSERPLTSYTIITKKPKHIRKE